MDQTAYDSLTDRQRECLRLVGQGFQSKTIAPRFRLSRHTIDKDLEAASRLVGAGDRFAAAQRLRAFENGQYERFVYEPPAIAGAFDPMADDASPPSASDGSADAPGQHVSEGQTPFVGFDAAWGSGASFGGKLRKAAHDLEPSARIAALMAAATLLAILAAGSLSIAHELQAMLVAWAFR